MPGGSGPVPIVTWKRVLVAVLTASAVFGAVIAFASSLTVNGAGLASGSDQVEACDTGFSFSFTLDGDVITHVTVGDIASACGGGALSITLTNEGNVAVGSGSGTVPAGGGSLTVPISSSPSTSSVYREHVSIVGP